MAQARSSPQKDGKIFKFKLPEAWAGNSKAAFNALVMLESKPNPRTNLELPPRSGRITMMASHGVGSPNLNGLVQMIDNA